MSADDDIADKEAEALFKIHGVDQRSAELAFSHPALGGEDAPVRMRQDGSTSKAFVPGTSTVIWPCAYSLGDYLCDATTAYRAKLGDGVGDATEAARVGAVTADTVAVELGAGLGLGGMVAARLGARHVAITDSTPAAASRNVQANGLGNAHVSELCWRRAAACISVAAASRCASAKLGGAAAASASLTLGTAVGNGASGAAAAGGSGAGGSSAL